METSKSDDTPLSRCSPEVLPYKNRHLLSPPPRRSEPAKRDSSPVETNGVVDSESFVPLFGPHRSMLMLLKYEDGGSWDEKLAFARDTQDCWTKGKVFAHEVRECAYDCACGMI